MLMGNECCAWKTASAIPGAPVVTCLEWLKGMLKECESSMLWHDSTPDFKTCTEEEQTGYKLPNRPHFYTKVLGLGSSKIMNASAAAVFLKNNNNRSAQKSHKLIKNFTSKVLSLIQNVKIQLNQAIRLTKTYFPEFDFLPLSCIEQFTYTRGHTPRIAI